MIYNIVHHLVLRLLVVALQFTVRLDYHDVDVERREPGRVLPVTVELEAALEHRRHHPAHEGLPAKHLEGRRELVMGHDTRCNPPVLEAPAQVVILHLITG